MQLRWENKDLMDGDGVTSGGRQQQADTSWAKTGFDKEASLNLVDIYSNKKDAVMRQQ